MNTISKLKILFFVLSIALVNCSKESSPDEQVIPITVSASDFTVTIDENPSSGQSLGTIIGTTNMGSVVFSVLNQTPAGSFTIDSNTGELLVAAIENFNFEQNPVITGTVNVLNGSVSEEASVTINLLDIFEINICDGNIMLLTQDEVNSFGAMNYTEVTGWLSIGNNSSSSTTIVDLSPLSSLQSVSFLTVSRADNLVDLTGFHNLTTCSNLLQILENDSLIDITALSNITTIASLYVAGNNLLPNLQGLHNLESSEYGLRIEVNNSLNDLTALSNITTVGQGFVLIENNPSLANLNGLHNIELIGGNLSIWRNNSLQNLNELSNLRRVDGLLGINFNDSLQTLDGLSNLEFANIIGISNNTSLLNIQGLSNINTVVNQIFISENPALTSLNGLNNITNVEDILSIYRNGALGDLSGLEGLSTIYDLRISENSSLQSLDGLNNLTSIDFLLDIRENGSLTDFCSLSHLFTGGNPPSIIFDVFDNAYNPTYSDMVNGNCRP